MPKIKRLDVQGYRGVSQPVSLLFEAKSILLFGENGTGKSSFIDALERLFTGRVSTLDGRAAGLSSERHGPHVRARAYPTEISVTFDDKRASTYRLQTDRTTLPTDVQRYLEAASQNIYILRRRQLLDFIESKPRDRYELLRSFLPISHFEAFEETIRQLRDRMETQFREAQQTEIGLGQDLFRILGTGAPATDPHSVTAMVNQQLESVAQSPIDNLAQLPAVTERLAQALVSFGDISYQSTLASVLDTINDVQREIDQIDVSPMIAAITALRERELHEAHVFYEAVLTEGARWIREEGRNTCPLCEQSIDAHTVLSRVEQRLAAINELLEQRRSATQQLAAIRGLVKAVQDVVRRLRKTSGTLRDSEKTLLEHQTVGLLSALEEMEQVLAAGHANLDIARLQGVAATLKAGTQLYRSLSKVKDDLATRLAAISVPQVARKVLAVHDALSRLREVWPAFVAAQEGTIALKQNLALVQRVTKAAEAARKEEVQALFDKLSDDINALYTQLHPDESHGNIHLEVREAVQQSATIQADFYEQASEDPRAYYSEAHLDTLGIAIFLALRRWYRQQQPAFDLLILDDILTSIDAAHTVRLAELILTDFAGYQLLVTTHDRIWFEHLRDIQSRCGVTQDFVNKVIHKWTIEEGPDLREPEDERRALERLLEEGSGQEIAVMAGRLLEHLLQEMRYSVRLSVQAKRGELYDIGDLWPAFYRAVKRDYPALYARAQKPLDSLEVRWPVRNWIGAHWNTWARNVPRTTAIEFAKAVRDLFDLVYCDNCHRFVSPSATPLGQLACRCGERIYAAPGKAAVRPKSREELVRATQGVLRDASLDTAKFFEAKRQERQREG